MNLLQTYIYLCIDNRCVDKRNGYACYKMTMHSPHSQNKTDEQLYKLGSGFGRLKKDSSHMIYVCKNHTSKQVISIHTVLLHTLYTIILSFTCMFYHYHLSIKIIFGVSITILTMENNYLMHIL